MEAQEKLTGLISRASDFVQNQIVPAAHRAMETGQPVAILIGKKSVTLAVALAREVVTNPFVQAGLVYGFFQPNHREYETWTHMLHRFLDGMSQYPIGLKAPRPLTEYEKFIKLIQNMYVWGRFGGTYAYKYTWMLKVAKMIGNHMIEEEGANAKSTKALLNKGVKSLQKLWNVYDYLSNPLSSITRTATRAIAGPIVEPLLRRSSDIDHDPTVRSSNQPLALPDHPASSSKSKVLAEIQAERRRKLCEDEPASSSKNNVLTTIQAQRRRRLHRNDTPSASSGEGRGQQALEKQAPLVNYGV